MSQHIYKKQENLKHTNSIVQFCEGHEMSTNNAPDSDFEVFEGSSPSRSQSRSTSVCSCMNQLAHYDWSGRLRPNLTRRCQPQLLPPFLGVGKKVVQLSMVAITNYSPADSIPMEENKSLTAPSDLEFEKGEIND